MEAIIPTEIGRPAFRTEVPRKANAEAISKDIGMADELREAVVIRIASYQQRMENLYNSHIKMHAFRVRDIVLRRVFENTTDPETSKFHSN